MTDICNLALYFISELIKLIPDSPFMFLVGLAIIIAIFNNIFRYCFSVKI